MAISQLASLAMANLSGSQSSAKSLWNITQFGENIQAELGDFEQRLNYEGTALEKPKFAVSTFVFDYTSETVKVLEIGQKGLMKELDALSQSEDYSNLPEWDFTISRTGMKLNTEYRIVPGPRKKGMQEKIDAAWSEAESKGYNLQALIVGESPFGESNA